MIAEATPTKKERTRTFTRAALRYCVVSVAFTNTRCNEKTRAESQRLASMLSWAEDEMMTALGHLAPQGSRERMELLAEALVGARDSAAKGATP